MEEIPREKGESWVRERGMGWEWVSVLLHPFLLLFLFFTVVTLIIYYTLPWKNKTSSIF